MTERIDPTGPGNPIQPARDRAPQPPLPTHTRGHAFDDPESHPLQSPPDPGPDPDPVRHDLIKIEIDVARRVEHGIDIDQVSVAEVVRRIQDEDLDPASLPAEVRLTCVQQLTLDGYTAGQTAALLGVTERTIMRDRAELRRQTALAPSVQLGDQLLGDYEQLARSSVQRLVRLAQDERAPHHARVKAEQAAAHMLDRLLHAARKIGYIDPGDRRIRHEIDSDPAEADRYRNKLKRLTSRPLDPNREQEPRTQ